MAEKMFSSSLAMSGREETAWKDCWTFPSLLRVDKSINTEARDNNTPNITNTMMQMRAALQDKGVVRQTAKAPQLP